MKAATAAWVLGAVLAAGPAGAQVLSDDLRAWLQAKGPVRAAPEADYGPFVYAEADGRIEGLSIDMLRLVQQHTGLQVVWLPPRPLSEQVAAARERRADLLTSLRPTPERSEYLAFTQPYVSVPAVLVLGPAAKVGSGPDPLRELAGRPVAVGKGYAVESVMKTRHPQVRWLPVPDDVEALRRVAAGQADGAVADAASVAFVMARHRLDGLHIAGRVGFDYTLSFAVRKDWPELREVIDRGIRAIKPEERSRVMGRWAPMLEAADHVPRARWATAVAGALLALALAAGLLAWHRRSRR